MTKEKIIECMNEYGTEYVHVDWPDLLNTKVHGINKSRYIASWANAGGKFNNGQFYDWLLTIEFDDGHMSEEEADEICGFASGGKLEFEIAAQNFLSK